MDFDFSAEQYSLRDEARRFLSERCTPAQVREVVDVPGAWSRDLWKQMADLGWMALPFDESYGGLGQSYLDLVLLLGELGAVLAPVPFLSSVACAGMAIARTGNDDQRARWLPGIASGDRIATLAYTDDDGMNSVAMQATRDGDGWRLDGVKRSVYDAPAADLFVVAAKAGDDERLFVVEDGFEITPQLGYDLTRAIGEVRFDGARAEPLDGKPYDAYRTMVTSACAEMVGVAQRVVDMTVQYSKERVQFGRPIGSFQAIKHRCAEMAMHLEASKAATYYACWAVDTGAEDKQLAVSTAKSYASDACGWIAGEGIQVHGGIAYTWEHDMHLYARRIKSLEAFAADSHWHREQIATIVGL